MSYWFIFIGNNKNKFGVGEKMNKFTLKCFKIPCLIQFQNVN